MPSEKPKREILNSISRHIFWDVDRKNIDLDHDKKFIIQRVMEYGLYKDWKLIHSYYGIKDIGRTAIQIRDLDFKSASFISLLSKVPPKKFLCYSIRQSMPPHWNF